MTIDVHCWLRGRIKTQLVLMDLPLVIALAACSEPRCVLTCKLWAAGSLLSYTGQVLLFFSQRFFSLKTEGCYMSGIF